METLLSNKEHTIAIGGNHPTRMIGERINPTGKKDLARALRENNLEPVRQEALSQIAAGASILDINVVTEGVDEITVLPLVIREILKITEVPLCIDVNNPEALEKALEIYPGKPLVNSVSAEKKSLEAVLPLVRDHKSAVIGLLLDDNGIPKTADDRMKIAYKILNQAEKLGIPAEDIIIDPLALALGSDFNAATVTLETVGLIKDKFGVNQTLGASNISFGLPARPVVNKAFLPLAMAAGVTCPTVDPVKVGSTIAATDLILGKDRFAMNYIKDFRNRTG